MTAVWQRRHFRPVPLRARTPQRPRSPAPSEPPDRLRLRSRPQKEIGALTFRRASTEYDATMPDLALAHRATRLLNCDGWCLRERIAIRIALSLGRRPYGAGRGSEGTSGQLLLCVWIRFQS